MSGSSVGFIFSAAALFWVYRMWGLRLLNMALNRPLTPAESERARELAARRFLWGPDRQLVDRFRVATNPDRARRHIRVYSIASCGLAIAGLVAIAVR